jgi:tRNA pseudouridine55 synthase
VSSTPVDGLVVVDKPSSWTSHDVVARCRRVFGQRRVGHAGTLDPDATGVLLVGLGRATRLLQFLTGAAKSYRGEVVLGVATSTLDASGEVTGRWPMEGVALDAVRQAAAGLTGVIDQVPPMVSAVQIGGRRLHELARRGIEVERPARRVSVTRFEVAPTSEPGVFAIEVSCSSGTYVRSLAADLGGALGGGAHLRRLRRTAAGPFTLADACPLDDVGADRVLSPAEALRGMARVVVDEATAATVRHGRVFSVAELAPSAADHDALAVLDADGVLLAVYQARAGSGDQLKPTVVLAGD